MFKYKYNDYFLMLCLAVLCTIFMIDIRHPAAFFGCLLVCSIILVGAYYATRKEKQP